MMKNIEEVTLQFPSPWFNKSPRYIEWHDDPHGMTDVTCCVKTYVICSIRARCGTTRPILAA